jgi:hypothetical protein
LRQPAIAETPLSPLLAAKSIRVGASHSVKRIAFTETWSLWRPFAKFEASRYHGALFLSVYLARHDS